MLTRSLKKDDLRSLLAGLSNVMPSTNLAKQIGLTPSALSNATQWAKASCLLDDQGLTPEGKLMALKDPYLEATVTDWVMHLNLSLSSRSLWSYIVCDFLPIHSQFTCEELLENCRQFLAGQTSDQLKKNINVVIKSYTENSAIAGIHFLERNKSIYSAGNPECSNTYVIGYLLAKIWENCFGSRDAVLVNDLLDSKPSFAAILGVQKIEIKRYLDNLEEYQIIERRSLKPYEIGSRASLKEATESNYQVVRLWSTPTELLERAYENDRSTPNQPLMRSLEGILDDTEDTLDFSSLLDWTISAMLFRGGSYPVLSMAS
jgi:Protein of unknown function (DUF4007)